MMDQTFLGIVAGAALLLATFGLASPKQVATPEEARTALLARTARST